MGDLIVVPQANQWQKLKRLVLDSVSSPITRRVYNPGAAAGLQQGDRDRLARALEARRLGAVSINVRITAVRKLGVEAADMRRHAA